MIRMSQINLQEQFIMAYGGLRGGVGFSLVKSISAAVLPTADMFVTTVLVLVGRLPQECYTPHGEWQRKIILLLPEFLLPWAKRRSLLS